MKRQTLIIAWIVFTCALVMAGCGAMNTITPPRAVWAVQATDNGTYYHVSGTIRNAGGQTLGVGAVAGYALDSQGVVLASEFDIITALLNAGETCELSLIFSKATCLNADRFRLVISTKPTAPLDPSGHTEWQTVVDNPYN